eukprot:403337258
MEEEDQKQQNNSSSNSQTNSSKIMQQQVDDQMQIQNSNQSYFQTQQYLQQNLEEEDKSAVLDANESENIQEDLNQDDDNQNLLDKSDVSQSKNQHQNHPLTSAKNHNTVHKEEQKLKQQNDQHHSNNKQSPATSPSKYNKNNTSQHTPAHEGATEQKLRADTLSDQADYQEENRKTEEKSFRAPNSKVINDSNASVKDKKKLVSRNSDENIMEIEEEHKHDSKQHVNAPYNFNQKPQQMVIGDSQPIQQAYKQHLLQLSPEQPILNKKQANTQLSQAGKFTEFLIAEKQRKFVRMPRVYGKRVPMQFKCPNCKTDREQRTKLKYECTGNQWCACIVFCFFACYPLCCVPFCIKRCYNVKHMCPQCYYQVGESGI